MAPPRVPARDSRGLTSFLRDNLVKRAVRRTMRAADSSHAPLTAALIRRASVPLLVEPEAIEPGAAPSSWRDNLQLFAITWAAGFVFFLVFLA